MPIPKPTSGQTENEFVSSCIATLVSEGKPQDQAAAICYDAWRNKDKMEDQQPIKTITIKNK